MRDRGSVGCALARNVARERATHLIHFVLPPFRDYATRTVTGGSASAATIVAATSTEAVSVILRS